MRLSASQGQYQDEFVPTRPRLKGREFAVQGPGRAPRLALRLFAIAARDAS